MKKIESIHFDLDSVLYIPSDFLETALQMSVNSMIQVGLRAGKQVALQKLWEIREEDSNAKDHFNQLCHHFNRVYDPIIIAAGVEKYWDCKISLMTSAPEANPILSVLYAKSRYDGEMNLQKHSFFASEKKLKQKPYPGLWRKAQKEMGFDFSRSVMVGDRYLQDIFGAKRLGMITIKVNQGPHANETIEEALTAYQRLEKDDPFFSGQYSLKQVRNLMIPDYAISHLKELTAVVEEISTTI
ncbi:MAG: HAD hydrolase-like protein [Deltaproteobacteria bacterium]